MSINGYINLVTDGLILYLDAANTKSYLSGTSWYDLTTYNNDGTLINGPTFSSTNGGSIVFDGVNDYVQVNNSDILNPTQTITLSVWSKFNGIYSGFYAPIIFKKNTAFSYFEQYQLAYLISGNIQVALGNGSSNQSANTPLSYTNQLINVVGTIDTINSVIKIYVNGDLKASTSIIYPNMSVSTSPVIIGGNAQGGFPGYMGGDIYNVSIYNRVLSDAEILQNYNATKWRYQ
jgi:hypothetical protein